MLLERGWKGIDLKKLRFPGERGLCFLGEMLRKNGESMSIPLWFRKQPEWWSFLREANKRKRPVDFFEEVLAGWPDWKRLVDGILKIDPSKDFLETFRTWKDDREEGMNAKWLWNGWLADRVFTLMMGVKGAGKSYVALKLLGMMMCGEEMPDGQMASKDLMGKKILWIDNERSQAYNTERAMKLGFPLDWFVYPTEELRVLQFDKDEDREIVEEAAERRGIGLVVIDSFGGSHGFPENHSDVGKVSAWMSDLAQNVGKAVWAFHHFRKPGRDNFKVGEFTMDDVRGHGSIIRTARMMLAVDIPDIENKESRRLRFLGGNISKGSEPIGFTIDGTGVHFCDAPNVRREETQKDRAVDFLKGLLGKSALPQKEISAMAEGLGISSSTLKRARIALGIVCRLMNKAWYWSLPCTKYGEGGEKNDE